MRPSVGHNPLNERPIENRLSSPIFDKEDAVRIDYLRTLSADEISPEVKELVRQLQQTLCSVTSEWSDNFKIAKELLAIAERLSVHQTDAALEAVDAVDVVELCSLPSMIGGSTFPNGGGQPFEWCWHIANGYFASLAEITRQAARRQEDCLPVVAKFVAEKKIRDPLLEFGGRHEFRNTVRKLAEDLRRLGCEDAAQELEDGEGP